MLSTEWQLLCRSMPRFAAYLNEGGDTTATGSAWNSAAMF
jgi:hypothetical protein